MKVWNYLCDEIAKDKSKDLKEDAFQKRISLFFQSALYWSSINDELREQYKIDFAHTKGRADIVLLKDNKIEIIIELKKPNHVQDAENIRQLADYMKVKSCLFGVYLGEKLELYFNEPYNNQEPKLVTSIAFVKDSKQGKELLDLLQNINFSAEALKTYCEKQIKLHEIMGRWLSPQGKRELLDYIIRQSNLDENGAEMLRELVDIKVVDLTANASQKKTSEAKNEKEHEAKPHDSMLYSLDNENFLSKRAFAFHVIRQVVENYPHMTFEEILALNRSKVFIRKKSEWETMTIDQKSRYCDNEDEILHDANGVEFLVTDQWTKEKIERQIVAICKHFQWKVYRK